MTTVYGGYYLGIYGGIVSGRHSLQGEATTHRHGVKAASHTLQGSSYYYIIVVDSYHKACATVTPPSDDVVKIRERMRTKFMKVSLEEEKRLRARKII